jgi:general secretion pathway protein C
MPLKPVFDSLRRAPWPAPLVNLALLVALAALLAHWTWRFAAPVSPPRPQAARSEVTLAAALTSLQAAQLFGAAEGGSSRTAERATTLNLKLQGVFAAVGDEAAWAILAVDGKDQAALKGREIQPGVVLDVVAPDHVILLNHGVAERLDLDAVGQPLALADGATPVTRQEIDRALANPRSLGIEVRPSGTGPDAGLLLTQVAATGAAARLGLQTGDVLRMVNGNPVGNMQDLAQVLSGAGGAQHVTVVGEREGKPLNLTFRLQQER